MAVLADIQDGVLQEDVCCSSAARGLSFLGRPLCAAARWGPEAVLRMRASAAPVWQLQMHRNASQWASKAQLPEDSYDVSVLFAGGALKQYTQALGIAHGLSW